MQFGFVPVFTKIFGYIIFVGIICRYYHHLVKGLEQNAHKGYYGNDFFQNGDLVVIAKLRVCDKSVNFSAMLIAGDSVCEKTSNFDSMRSGYLLLAAAYCLFVAAGCKPSDSTTISGGGKGGNVTIRISPEYYDSFVDTCVVYVKYGTLDAPANNIYDDSVVCTVSNDTSVAVFPGLTTGLYYFYGVGYHSAGGHPPNVKGSKNCTIQSDGNYTFYLPTFYYIP